jgi:hypothetical protein
LKIEWGRDAPIGRPDIRRTGGFRPTRKPQPSSIIRIRDIMEYFYLAAPDGGLCESEGAHCPQARTSPNVPKDGTAERWGLLKNYP